VIVGAREYQFLSAHIAGRILEPLLVTVRPTTEPQVPYGHDGEEFAWVLTGELVYVVGNDEHLLRSGDCIHVRSSQPHAIRNENAKGAQVLWVLSQPMVRESLGDLAIQNARRDGNSVAISRIDS
jgi:mannose-6-phosphate isomerase-like protein (cupin superfamily)